MRSPTTGKGNYTAVTYAVIIPTIKGGTITAFPYAASQGTVMTITATPDKGYKLDSLFVVDKNGEMISITKASDSQYTFTMPSGKLTVDAEFGEVWCESFNDVSESAWYYSGVEFVSENGLMNGVGNKLVCS